MRRFLDRYLLNPHWRTLKVVGQAKVLGISATTIIVAPLLSRILIKLNEMEISIRQSHPALNALFPLIKYHFELPLSIKLLVGSAVFAGLGKILYETRCPVYIKVGDTYEQFRNTRARATDVLTDGFLKIMQGFDKEKKDGIVRGLLALKVTFAQPRFPVTDQWAADTTVSFAVGGRPHPSSGAVADAVRFLEIGGPLYYVLRDVMDDSRRAARVACAVLYGLAFVLLTGALGIQFWWAVQGMLL